MKQRHKVVAFFCGVLCLYFVRSNNSERNLRRNIVPKKTEGKIVIYSATSYFGSKIEDRWTLWRCKDVQEWCHFTSKPSYRPIADAVIFHANNFELDEAPRSPDQVFVWFTGESAVHQVIDVPENYINWTMTYRTDSDVWYPYNRMERIFSPPRSLDLDDIWESKLEMAAWVGSNCLTDNRRTEMIYLLQKKGLEAEIFGSCGKSLPSCSRFSKKSADCRSKAMRPYKFYLAFENSNCLDYVTEKIFNSFSSYLAVPIVIKRDYYRNYGIPDDAYIAIDDFEDVDSLVDHLNRVGSNKTEYLKYHEWRKTHRVAGPGNQAGFCGLCHRLLQRNYTVKSYSDLAQWFSPAKCEQRFLDRYLGRSHIDRMLCKIYSIIYFKFYWDCS